MRSIIKSRKYNNKKYNNRYKKSKLKNKRKKYSSSKYKRKNLRKKTKRRKTVLKGGNDNEEPEYEVIKENVEQQEQLYEVPVSISKKVKLEDFLCTIIPVKGKGKKIPLNFQELLENIFGEGEELAREFNDTYNKKNENSIELSEKIDKLSKDKILGSGDFGKIYKLKNEREEFAVKLYKVPYDKVPYDEAEEILILKGLRKTPVDPFTYLFILQKTLSGKTILISPTKDNERYNEIINEYETLENLQGIPGICETKGLIVLTGEKVLVAGYAMEKLEGFDLTNYILNDNFKLEKKVSNVKGIKVKELVKLYNPDLTLENFVEQLITIMDNVFEKEYVHNDLYARNIFITNKNEVYMIDWGLSRKIGGKYDGGKIPRENLRLSTYSRAEDVFCLAQLIIKLIGKNINIKSYANEIKNKPIEYVKVEQNPENQELYPLSNIPPTENIEDIELITTKKDELSKKFTYENSEIQNIMNFIKKILDTNYLIDLYKKDNKVGNFNEELPTLKQIFENPKILDKKTTVTP